MILDHPLTRLLKVAESILKEIKALRKDLKK